MAAEKKGLLSQKMSNTSSLTRLKEENHRKTDPKTCHDGFPGHAPHVEECLLLVQQHGSTPSLDDDVVPARLSCFHNVAG